MKFFQCRCVSGFADLSPAENPGRICEHEQKKCQDSSLNDCHRFAECYDSPGKGGYRCKCRVGYVDRSPDTVKLPGRLCELEDLPTRPPTPTPRKNSLI